MASLFLIGPVPPPIFGQARCTQILWESRDLRERFSLVLVNTNNVGKTRTRRVLSTIRALCECLTKLIRHRPALVYVTITRSKLGCVKDCLFFYLASLWKARILAHLHGGDLQVFYRGLSPRWKSLVRRAYARVDLAIVEGETLRPQFDGLVSPDRVRVLRNCFPESSSAAARPENSRNGVLRLAFMSNVLPSKGLFDALEGVAWAIREGVQLEFRFTGAFLDHDGALAKLPEFAPENLSAGALAERFERLVKILGIADYVARLGVVSEQQKRHLLADTDILLLPIFNPTEGQPLIAIEAMRAGCAIISTQCGGLADIAVDGVTGRVVAPRSPSEIGKAIKWFSDHPAELDKMGRDNMERAERFHSPKEHVRRLREIFDEALSMNGRSKKANQVLAASQRHGPALPQRGAPSK